MDQHLISEGRHEQLWKVLGAHVRRYERLAATVIGTSFAVWAPNARGVRVAGDFNFWDGRAHPMRSLGSTGVWELFVPDVGKGAHVQVRGARRGRRVAPQGRPDGHAHPSPAASAPPSSASRSTRGTTTSGCGARAERPTEPPMSVYEVHLGSWRTDRSYTQLAEELVDYVVELGFTHVELLPVVEHPFGGSWGYQVTSYFAPTARFGDPDELRLLIDRLHQAGIGVILDWVPAHFPKDDWALARFDGTPLYEHADPARGEHPEWGTYIFDFGRREVRNFLVANALYWLEEFHIDGLRVDAVASMLYLDYSRERGPVDAEHPRRPREPRGRLVPAGGECHLLQAGARRRHDRRGVDGVARRHPADARRRARVRLQVEHGLDARHARLHGPRPDPPAVPPPPDDVLDDVRVLRELRAAALPRRGRARQGVAAPQDAGRSVAAARQPAGLPRVHVGASRASS